MTMSIEADGPDPTSEPGSVAIPCRSRNARNTSGSSSPIRVSSLNGIPARDQAHAMLRTPPPGRTRSRPR